MKKLLLILLCLPMIGFGQGWETTFGGTSDEEGLSYQMGEQFEELKAQTNIPFIEIYDDGTLEKRITIE